MKQVLPVDDCAEHEETGTMCRCGPEVDWSGAEALVIHYAFDGRDITTVKFSDGKWFIKRENPL